MPKTWQAPAAFESIVKIPRYEVDFGADEEQTVEPRVTERNGVQPIFHLKRNFNTWWRDFKWAHNLLQLTVSFFNYAEYNHIDSLAI